MQNAFHANNSSRLAVGMVWNTPLLERYPRRLQSRLADIAQDLIGTRFADLPTPHGLSRAHCRGVSAACLIEPEFAVGIDIEWLDPRRKWIEIIAIYVPSIADLSPSPTQLVCAWVFLEAFYKAEQRLPTETEIRDMLSRFQSHDAKIDLASGACVYFRQLPSDLMLCLYWRRRDAQIATKMTISFLEAKVGDIAAGTPGELSVQELETAPVETVVCA